MMVRVLLVMAMLISSPLWAAGLSTVGTSTVAMGSGGTGSANPDDPGAAYLNPAATASFEGFRSSVGFIGISPTLTATNPRLSHSTTPSFATPPHIHASYAFEYGGAGISLTVPYATGSGWDPNWEYRFDVSSSALKVFRVAPFISGKYKSVSIAVGPLLDWGDFQLSRSLNFISEEGQVEVETTGHGFGAHGGIFWKTNDQLSVGLSYKSQVHLPFSGYANFQNPDEFSQAVPQGKADIDLTLPSQWVVGAQWSPTEDVDIAVDFEITQWDSIHKVYIELESDPESSPDDTPPWQPTFTPRFGATWRAFPILTARTGLFYDPSPVPAAMVGVTSPDSSRMGFTCGASLNFTEFLSLDVGYQYLLFMGSQTPSSSTETISFEGNAHLIGSSIGIHL